MPPKLADITHANTIYPKTGSGKCQFFFACDPKGAPGTKQLFMTLPAHEKAFDIGFKHFARILGHRTLNPGRHDHNGVHFDFDLTRGT